MDAPFHFFEEGRTIDQVSQDQCVGWAILIKLTNSINNGLIEVQQLTPHRAKLRELGKVVIQTGWSEKWGQPEYYSDHPVFTPEAAQFAIDCRAHLVWVGFPSVDRPPLPEHLAFLGKGIVVVKNRTNLAAIEKEVFHLVLLPLKITPREGSPVRAIALEVS